jgi:hypothetical protein
LPFETWYFSLALAGIAFGLWILFHASYSDRVEKKRQAEMTKVKGWMSGTLQTGTKVTDAQLDTWLQYISKQYARVTQLPTRLNRICDGFLYSGVFSLSATIVA